MTFLLLKFFSFIGRDVWLGNFSLARVAVKLNLLVCQIGLQKKRRGSPSNMRAAAMTNVETSPKHSQLITWLLLVAFSCIVYGSSVLQPATAQSQGFISIDCGGRYSGISKDSNGIEWTSDTSSFMSVGDSVAVVPPTDGSNNYGSSQEFSSIRYFPDTVQQQSKFCYILPNITSGIFVMVRVGFWLGKNYSSVYGNVNELTVKLLVDADEWDNVSIALPQANPLFREMYMFAKAPSIAVCLAASGGGRDAPFVSTIELRPLNNNLVYLAEMLLPMFPGPPHFIEAEHRINFGAQSSAPIRYPEDVFDRIWDANQTQPSLHTSHNVSSVYPEEPPSAMLQTAFYQNGGFDLTMQVQQQNESYLCVLYFAEIDPRVNATGMRAFSVQFAELSISPVLMDIISTVGLYADQEIAPPTFEQAPNSAGQINIIFRPAAKASYPPLISGLEIFRFYNYPPSNGTSQQDVAALEDLKKSFASLRTWAGDPCLPIGYGYNWLNCSNSSNTQITALLLSNLSLVGELPPSINQLTGLTQISLSGNKLQGIIPDLSSLSSLQILDLRSNNLSGSIPDSLSTLPSLKYLYLQNNNFSGPIPSALLKRVQSGLLYFDYVGNSFLCTTSNATCFNAASNDSQISHTKSGHLGLFIGLPVLLVIGAIIVTAISACYITSRRRHVRNHIGKDSQMVRHTDLAEVSKTIRVFKYKDIVAITDNFSKILGEGGFGPVYEGQIPGGALVAVKVLSENSRQGAREFVNEVALLSRLYHKNLVALLGYCIDRNLVLVYEFMPKGTLGDILYGCNKMDLPWATRLGIAADAVQGLEYLHRGCNPPIIHRDVKSTNILLSDKLEAKIADFGISRLRRNDTAPSFTTTVMGSNGYHDPDYTSPQKLTTKVDVYSTGVVLLEIIAGRPPLNRNVAPSDPVYIVEWARAFLERGNIEELVDKALGNNYNISSMWKVAEVALMCVDDSDKRPTMSEIFLELQDAMHMELGSEVKLDASAYDTCMPKEIDGTLSLGLLAR